MGRITLTKINKRLGNTTIIEDLNLDVQNGEFVVCVGPSGCGKTTLLRLIAGLEDVDSGTIRIDGHDVANTPPSRRGLSMVFQSYALYPHMTVRRNIGFALELARLPRREIDAKVEAAAAKLNLGALLDRKPRELSGGQRQRVAIGRAIVRTPTAFLFDEPLSNLDAALRVQMRFELVRLQKELGITALYVTHDQIEAMTMGDKIVVLNAGVIVQYDTPLNIYRQPADTFVAGFIGSPKMNLIRGAVASARHATTVGVRPEHFVIDEGGSGWPGTIAMVEYLGSDTYLHVDAGEYGLLIVRKNGEFAATSGMHVSLTPVEQHVHRFDATGRRIAA
jgi:multiple sugar transport system ATP-binding protein